MSAVAGNEPVPQGAPLLPEVHWDRSAERWRVTVGEKPIVDGDGRPLSWDCFNDAYDVMVRMQREASGHPAELVRTAARPAVPEVGTWVVDTRSDRTAVVTDVKDGRLYLRPAFGRGAEWEAMPVHVRPATERERLSSRVAEVNYRSQQGGWM